MSSAKRKRALKRQQFLFNIVKILVGCFTLVLSTAIYMATISSIQQDSNLLRRAVSILVHALNDKNIAILRPLLAREYKVGNLTGEAARDSLNHFVSNYQHRISSYSLQNKTKQADGTYEIEVLMQCSDCNRQGKSRFKLNNKGAFLELNLIAPTSNVGSISANYAQSLSSPSNDKLGSYA